MLNGHGFKMLVIDTLRGKKSPRGCRRCGEAIRLDDEFGLSEGICRSCAWRSDSVTLPTVETTGVSRLYPV